MEISAPPEKAGFADVMIAPVMAASERIWPPILSNSSITVSSMTFIDFPGMSQAMSAIPSPPMSSVKFRITPAR